MKRLMCLAVALLLMAPGFFAYAQAPNAASPVPKILLERSEGALKHLTPSSDQVSIARSTNPSLPGIAVTIQPGKDAYPGVNIKPENVPLNLAAYGHVEAQVVNTGNKPLTLALRVDNAGDWRDNPWNTESIDLAPGATGVITVIFGYSYGHKPGYALKPAAVTNFVLFTGKSEEAQSFSIESLLAGGQTGENPPFPPDAVRIKPKGGILLGRGAVDGATQLSSQEARASMVYTPYSSALWVVFRPSKGDAWVALKPTQGRWDLRDFLEVQVNVHNAGKVSVTPRVRLDTNGGPSDWVTAQKPLAPGTETVLTIPFISTTTPDLSKPETVRRFTSDATAAVTIGADPADSERVLLVSDITARVPPPPHLPDWLGKRPPVPGPWVKTLDDEFNGATLNPSLWSVYGENYWDKASHWSKKDVLIGGGVVKLRYEKQIGFNNDDPKQAQTRYAAGYLHTYDRWTQRYGYFEARMKLPTAPGLWPAFWMMPDRGAAAGPEQWKRQDTANGGMEFDIMEHLTRWGPYRYNIAMHYDGYGKDHKSLGSDCIYVQPDKDGFFTCGLLWSPGSVIYYCNGREVLRWENPRISNVPAILMFTLPTGGWDNSPLDDAHLPADFVIDYVRVWQRK